MERRRLDEDRLCSRHDGNGSVVNRELEL
jgi:hypothetical protein